MSVNAWLDYVEKSFQLPQSQTASALANLFILDLEQPIVSSLQNDIFDNGIDITTTVEAKNLHDGDWNTFVELCITYLQFTRDVDPNNIDSYYIALIQFFTALSPAFSNFRGSVLQTVLKNSASVVMDISKTLDKRDGSFTRTNYASTLLLKMFNSIRGEKMDPNNPSALSKKSIMLFIGNLLCRAYYILSSHASCANVFSNVDSSNIKFSRYPRSQLVEYRYFLGRFYLDRAQQVKAYNYLKWSFDNALSSSSNKRRILQILIPTSILLGRFPTLQLLQQYNLAEIYWPLVRAMKSGNYGQYMQHLEGEYKPWFYKNRLLIFLKTRSQIVLFRQIFVKTWKALDHSDILPFKMIRRALELSTQADPEGFYKQVDDRDFLITENIAISLISQGFIKGNIFTRSELIKLKASGAFPPLTEVHHTDKVTLI